MTTTVLNIGHALYQTSIVKTVTVVSDLSPQAYDKLQPGDFP